MPPNIETSLSFVIRILGCRLDFWRYCTEKLHKSTPVQHSFAASEHTNIIIAPMGRGVKYWGGFAALLFVVFCFSAVFDALRAVFTQERFTSMTSFLCVVFNALRAPLTQYGFTVFLGRCVWLYLMNRMGHA